MNISKGLALKSLGALGAAAAAGLGLGLENSPLRNALGLGSSSSGGEIKIGAMAEKVGLNCSANSDECTIGEGKFNVFIDSSKKLTGALKSANSSGKIKFEENQEGYNQKFKFTIIDGDINFSNTGASNTKLEKYETYEAKEHDGVWYFSRINTAPEGKSRILGLPEGCNIPSGDEKVECSLNATQLKNINFEGKSNMVVNEGITAKLAIKKLDTDSSSLSVFGGYYEGIKFTLGITEDIEINKDGGREIKFLRNTDPEFKIKEVNNRLTLERAWTKNNLKEFTVDSFTMDNKGGEWTISTIGSAINTIDENDLELKAADGDDENDLEISVEENQEGYGQGFRFKFNKAVSLGKTENSRWEKKIDLNDGDYFELKTKGFGEDKRYFSKKTNP